MPQANLHAFWEQSRDKQPPRNFSVDENGSRQSSDGESRGVMAAQSKRTRPPSVSPQKHTAAALGMKQQPPPSPSTLKQRPRYSHGVIVSPVKKKLYDSVSQDHAHAQKLLKHALPSLLNIAANKENNENGVFDEFEDLSDDILDTVDASLLHSMMDALDGKRLEPADPTTQSVTQAVQDLRVKKIKSYERFTVVAVTITQATNVPGKVGDFQQKTLSLFPQSNTPASSSPPSSGSTSTIVTCHLRSDWMRTRVKVGDVVHLIDAGSSNPRIVDNERGFLVVHPDTLISGTVVSDSLTCLRRSVISSRIKFGGDRSTAMLYGSMLHEIFQLGIIHGFDKEQVQEYCKTVVTEHLEDLWCLGETEMVALAHLEEMVPRFREWANAFLADTPNDAASVTEHRGNRKKSSVALQKIVDIEENIWSPMFGLKGKVDATVQARHRHPDGSGPLRTSVTPLELKTGKSTQNMSHRAQTSLYTLLLSDRYDVDVDFGLLYYCRTNETIRVPAINDERRPLIMARNELANYLFTRTKLPPVIKNLHVCQRCYNLDVCMTMHKALERGTADTSGLGSLFEAKTSHLAPHHTRFLEQWESMTSREEEAYTQYLHEIWCMDSQEREKLGRCVSGMKVVEHVETELGGLTSWRFKYKFQRGSPKVEGVDRSLFSCQLVVGDPVIVSSEDMDYALAMGFLVELNEHDLTVALDRKSVYGCLRHSLLQGRIGRINVPRRTPKFDSRSNQDHDGLVEFKTKWDAQGAHLQRLLPDDSKSPSTRRNVLYRIDQNEMSRGMGIARYNLLHLFLPEGDERTRKLIVDLEEPQFCSAWRDVLARESHKRFEELQASVHSSSLNEDQRRALNMVLNGMVVAKDYALILGMPGTGKTSTIAQLVSTLQLLGKSVLIASYTHSAVDNILLKLKERNMDFLRIGNAEKVHPELHSYLPRPCETVAQMETAYCSASVVATTCLGVSHAIFVKRTFDVCIIDEASQLTLPVSLGPLRYAKSFVLVGDHYQLPAVVQSEEARKGGYADSLFKRLSEAHPKAVVELRHQYRMNAEIMMLANHMIYDGKLVCGSESVAKRRLALGNGTDAHVGWMATILDSSRPVLFLNTDGMEADEVRNGDILQNPKEVALIQQMIAALVDGGVKQQDIGVISPYRSQLLLLLRELSDFPEVESLTVDRYQGRDKNCILISFVRSNPDRNVGELLLDWRRLNVALTRAKSKMILVGSRRTLASTLLLKQMLVMMEERGWIVNACEKDPGHPLSA